MAFVKYIHLLLLITGLGGMIFFSFVAAPSIFKSFPRETAGDIVGAIFPKYFAIGYVASAGLLATLLFIGWGKLVELRVPLALLVAVTALTLISGMIIGAKARGIKTEIRQMEDGEKKAELKKVFGKLHGISMMVNITIIVLNLIYVAYIPTVLRL